MKFEPSTWMYGTAATSGRTTAVNAVRTSDFILMNACLDRSKNERSLYSMYKPKKANVTVSKQEVFILIKT